MVGTAGGGGGGGEIVRGFPHLATVRASLTALYRRMSPDTVHRFAASVRPEQVAVGRREDAVEAAQHVARVMVDHMRLPSARVIVTFRDMVHAGSVELTAGPEYFVELNTRFRRDPRDVGACLAHEVAHVYLHRLGLECAGTRDNEILTDTAAAYLGTGWPLLDAFREESVIRGGRRLVRSASKLGYLTPEEFGYVLAKRAAAFDDDVEPWLSSVRAREAYREGLRLAERDVRRAPLAAAGWGTARRYAVARRLARAAAEGARVAGPDGCEFDRRGARVSFACPTCFQRLRVPVRGRFAARCGVCGARWECDT